MPKVRNLLFHFFFAAFFIGCASNFANDLKKIKVGDDKSRVLDILGNPRRTSRIKDRDRWTYTYQEAGQEKAEHIDFHNGKVVRFAEKEGNSTDVTPENAETYEQYQESILKRRKK